ncbi:enterochelin ABC transporter permease [Brevibacterium sediminis]|uniref:Enterochelin ABC transporter permease n=1 Tax=Brevibacterium sediminis TaxID=1857024 RepID=A0ABQ1M6K1_9MICO|nr:iron chelate uptake ABC transporter family permease subunit [Brevibacterium sediminis]GGC35833.1 enterochelin ABC transporter permease [Brevibacterium sediminis]
MPMRAKDESPGHTGAEAADPTAVTDIPGGDRRSSANEASGDRSGAGVRDGGLPRRESASVRRSSGPLPTAKSARRYWTMIIVLSVASAGIALGILAWDNPMPITDPGFWLIAELRLTNLVVIAMVALCQSFGTVAFQTVTNNRIITPSIMGFESLYVAIQTSAMYFFGVTAIVELKGLVPFVVQLVLMVGLSLALYGWLLSGRHSSVALMLLIGVVIGGGLGSVATFMQRTLTPSEFDVLSARLFGSISNSDSSYLPVSIPLCVLACLGLYLCSSRLNVMALGRDMTSNLGLNYKGELLKVLFFVSILMAVSVSMIGPMVFLGFLVAMLAYQFADTYDHKRLFPMAALLGFVVLGGAYFVMKNIFYAEGFVSIIIEIGGGGAFLLVILRKGRL